MTYPDDFIDKVICGDCLELMKEIPDKSVDLVLTDPPYGLDWSGMGFAKQDIARRNIANLRQWDKKPSKKHFEEIIRIS